MKSILYTFILIAVFAFFGCSNNDANNADNQTSNANNQGNVMTSEDSAAMGLNDTTARDTLAQKVYPIRNPKNKFVTLQTDFGNLVLELYHDVAPAHVDSFVARTKEGFYDGTIFHRIIKNFMIQGGDPQGNGSGGAGYYLKAEFSDLPHQDGTLSMARSTDPNSASSQFFVCLGRNSMTASLDGKYTVFGQLIRGYDALHKIGDVQCVQNPYNPREISRPAEEVFLRRAFVSDQMGNPLGDSK